MSDTYRGPDGVLRRKPGSQQQQPKQQQPKPDSHPLDIFVGKRIVLQRGPVTYGGTLRAITRRWLIFAEATITAADGSLSTVAEVYVNADLVHLEQPDHDGNRQA